MNAVIKLEMYWLQKCESVDATRETTANEEARIRYGIRRQVRRTS